jgi:hypothetical protein
MSALGLTQPPSALTTSTFALPPWRVETTRIDAYKCRDGEGSQSAWR